MGTEGPCDLFLNGYYSTLLSENLVSNQVPAKRWVSYLQETVGRKFQLIDESLTRTEEKVHGSLFFNL